eukprot:COSAG02_NODE_3829_length_6176_cov_26.434096_3_plen_74_part_00
MSELFFTRFSPNSELVQFVSEITLWPRLWWTTTTSSDPPRDRTADDATHDATRRRVIQVGAWDAYVASYVHIL